jgi:hypothetical protein
MSDLDNLKTYLEAKFHEVGVQLTHSTNSMGQIREEIQEQAGRQADADTNITTNTQAIRRQTTDLADQGHRLTQVESVVLDMQRRSHKK